MLHSYYLKQKIHVRDFELGYEFELEMPSEESDMSNT